MKNLAVMVAVAALVGPVTIGAGADKAADVVSQARKALGGEDKVSAVKTIVATGKSQRQMGQMQVGGEIEVAVSLPDRYLRTQVDTMMGATITRETGFSGSELLERSVAPPGARVMFRAGGDDADPERAKQMRLQAQRNELSRLLVAWLVAAPAYAQAQFTYAGEAESPDGRADVVEVKGADGLAMRVFLDKNTHRPLMITYQGRPPVIRTQTMGPGGHAPGAERTMHAEAPAVTEIQWFVDDFRQVGDVWLPHRLVQAAGGNTIEEWEFSKIVVNQPIKDDTFRK